eukprot:1703066-Heterocapsa_arctica.AAC.1
MRKYQKLVNRKQEAGEEGLRLLYKLEGIIGRQDLEDMEDKLATMRTKLNNERSQRWRSWVENSWGRKKKYMYK